MSTCGVQRKDTRYGAALVAITLVGLAIRLWHLDAAGVWFDEAYHVALVRLSDLPTMLDAILSNPPSDPLYAVVLRGWVEIAGHADGVIRLPSVVVGTVTIPAAAWLARELDGRRAVALLTALFVALSPYALEFSQEAAPYALAALATTLTLAATWRWRRTGLAWDGVLAVGLAIVAVYAHYVAVAVLGVVWLAGWSSRAGPSRVARVPWLIAPVVVLVAWAPWLIGLGQHWLVSAAPRPTLRSPATLDQLLGALAQYVAGTAALLEGARPLLVAEVALGVVLAALGWRAGRDPDRRGLRVIVVTAAILFLAPALVSAATGAWLFVAHFGLLMLPAGLTVVAAGVVEASALVARRSIPARATAAVLAIAWCAIAVIGVGMFYQSPPHGDDGLRELVATLDGAAMADDAVLVAPAALTPSLAQYTDRRLTGIPADFDLWDIYSSAARPASDDELRAAVRSAAIGHARVWLVSRPELAADRVIRDELGKSFSLVAATPVEFATLYRFDAQRNARVAEERWWR
jgi:4-amino-4-deoxy-L-arabinose transferase-like glycosyltransferase